MDAVGILSEISGVLARSGISVLCVATYDTDYFLIGREQQEQACQALMKAGHAIA